MKRHSSPPQYDGVGHGVGGLGGQYRQRERESYDGDARPRRHDMPRVFVAGEIGRRRGRMKIKAESGGVLVVEDVCRSSFDVVRSSRALTPAQLSLGGNLRNDITVRMMYWNMFVMRCGVGCVGSTGRRRRYEWKNGRELGP